MLFVNGDHLEVGRHSLEPDEARALLVENARFDASTTRVGLWDDLERFLSKFYELEETLAKAQPSTSFEPLVDRMWLGGSFASAKRDPRNVDLTLFLNKQVKDAIKGLPGARLFKRTRDHFQNNYRVSPLFVDYMPVPNVFQMDLFNEEDRAYFIQRGIWDDWWQRDRDPHGSGAPTVSSCIPRRGYLEVAL